MGNFYNDHADEFKFGWEVEMMVTSAESTPLFGETLSFDKLRDIINSAKVDDIPYLKEKYKGSGLRPYYIEGYDAGYEDGTVKNVVVKGIEIRTPITFSIEKSVSCFENYYNQMQGIMEKHAMRLSCFGNHPFQPAFKGARGQRDVVGWASAETAMTTHGLVINLSLPDALEAKLNRDLLNVRFSYAAPVMILFAANTPFRMGALWKPEGQQAWSDRSYRRSFVRNTVYYRDDQHHRKEVTLFDMTNDLSLFEAYAALSLGIILSEDEFTAIPDRFSKENVRRAALLGYEAAFIDRHQESFRPDKAADKVLTACAKALTQHGFEASLLDPLWALLARRVVPAQGTVADFSRLGGSIQKVLAERSTLVRTNRRLAISS